MKAMPGRYLGFQHFTMYRLTVAAIIIVIAHSGALVAATSLVLPGQIEAEDYSSISKGTSGTVRTRLSLLTRTLSGVHYFTASICCPVRSSF